MSNRSRALLAYLLLSLPLAAWCTEPERSATPSVELERLEWHDKPGDVRVVSLVNRWGDIRLRQTGDAEILAHGVMQKIGEKPRRAILRRRVLDGRVELEIAYPAGEEPASEREGRVDMALLVPQGIAAEVVADRGRVYASFSSTLSVRATAQPVHIKSDGPLQVETDSAPVVLQMRSGGAPDRGRIVTRSGDIEVILRAGQPARFSVVSGGSRASNAADLLASRRHDGRAVVFSRGSEPPRLALQTDDGRVILNDLGGESTLGTAGRAAAPPSD